MEQNQLWELFLKVTGLNGNRELRIDIIKQIYEYSKLSDDYSAKSFLDLHLQFKRSGFRKGKVPKNVFINEMGQFHTLPPEILSLIFEIWISANPEIVNQYENLSDEFDLDVYLLNEEGLSEEELISELNRMTTNYLEKNTNVTETYARIFLAHRMIFGSTEDDRDFEEPEEDFQCAKEKLPTFWKNILNQIESLPHNSDDWAFCDGFTDLVKKLQVRAYTNLYAEKETVSAELSSIIEDNERILSYLGLIERLKSVKPDLHSVDNIENIFELFKTLRERIDAFHKVPVEGFDTFDEEDKARTKRNRIKKEIESKILEIENIFSTEETGYFHEQEEEIKQSHGLIEESYQERESDDSHGDIDEKTFDDIKQHPDIKEIDNHKDKVESDEDLADHGPESKPIDDEFEASYSASEFDEEAFASESMYNEQVNLSQVTDENNNLTTDEEGLSEEEIQNGISETQKEVSDSNESIGKAEKHEGSEDIDSRIEDEEVFNEIVDANISEESAVHWTKKDIEDVCRDCIEEPKNFENWERFLFALINEGDIAAAYWISKSLEIEKEGYFLSSAIVKALQGSQWVNFGSDAFVTDLMDIAEKVNPISEPCLDFLTLSASLRPIFLVQALNYLGWIRVPSQLPEIKPITEAIMQFVSAGAIFQPADLVGVTGDERREQEILEIVGEAKDFISNAPNRKVGFWRASDVWRRMISAEAELGRLIEIVSLDQRGKIKNLKSGIRDWNHQDYVLGKIRDIEERLGRGRLKEIDGRARQGLLTKVQEAVSIINRWINILEIEHKQQDKGGTWLQNQISDFRSSLQEHLPNVGEKLILLTQEEPMIASSATCLINSMQSFQEIFQVDSLPGCPMMWNESKWEWLTHDTANLNEALGNRLLWVGGVVLDNTRKPTSTGIDFRALIAKSILEAKDSESLFQQWLEGKDFRFEDTFLASIDTGNIANISSKIEDQKDASRELLKKRIAETDAAIEQAVVDGIIAEERSEYSGMIHTILPDDTVDFIREFNLLDRVHYALDKAREDRLRELEKRWNEIRPQILKSWLTEEQKETIVTFVSGRINAGDTRVVEENLSQLDELLDKKIEPEEGWFQPPGIETNVLQEYIDKAEEIDSWIQENDFRRIIQGLEKQNIFPEFNFQELDSARRNELIGVVQSWKTLKHDKPKNNIDIRKHLLKIIRYVGFTLNPETARKALHDRSESNWWHGVIDMSAGDLAKPFPQFGSQTNGRYDVVCFWGRPDPNIIASKLSALGLSSSCVIVIFLGSLSPTKRGHILRISQGRQLAIAVMDETLLVYLAKEQDTRLSVLLRCSLPFSAINPYTPFKAGDVPYEMFFGRERMARQIQALGESCFVYGGRQLGKSALLRRVEQSFHNPQRDQYAKVEDIKLVGDFTTAHSPSNIWIRIREIFKEFGLIGKKVVTTKPEEIFKYVRNSVKEKTERRVLLLFDEADNFLESDSKDNFQMVDMIRILMAETNRRFKAVFAGLHNVQRYQGIPNQPLAHFGSPICVGPLEPLAAKALVEEPLQALGFRLDDATTLRILSYTNYHPGLIQLFCMELLRLLQSRFKAGLPPYDVGQEIVESVYRNPDVYRNIKERFDWTLALDQRYQAVAWSLIVEQMDIRDSYSKSFSTSEVLSLVQFHWKRGFIDTDISSMRGLLDEMVGLGVLVRDKENRYRLRSPNLVRIMGTQEDIFAQLDELSKKDLLVSSEADHYHVPLDEKAHHFSPLTHSQERRLSPQVSGAAMVLATHATGLADLPTAYKRLVPGNDGDFNGYYEDISAKLTEEESPKDILNQLWKSKSEFPAAIIGVFPNAEQCKRLPDLIEDCLHFLETRKTDKRWMRVLITLNAETAIEWFNFERDYREAIEERMDAVVSPHKLDIPGIRQRLALATPEKVYTEDVCKKVRKATGGWPFLIDEVFRLCEKETDPRPAAEKVYQMISDPNSELSNNFLNSIEVDTRHHFWRVVETIIDLEEENIPVDLFDEVILEEHPAIYDKRVDIVEYLRRFGVLCVQVDSIAVDPIIRGMFQN